MGKLLYFEIHLLICSSLVTNLVLCLGVKLLHTIERLGLSDHREEGGVGGPEVLKQHHAAHHHQQKQHPGALVPRLRLRSLQMMKVDILHLIKTLDSLRDHEDGKEIVDQRHFTAVK